MSAPQQGVPIELVLENTERFLVSIVRELAVTRSRLSVVEEEKAELQRQLRVRDVVVPDSAVVPEQSHDSE